LTRLDAGCEAALVTDHANSGARVVYGVLAAGRAEKRLARRLMTPDAAAVLAIAGHGGRFRCREGVLVVDAHGRKAEDIARFAEALIEGAKEAQRSADPGGTPDDVH
jgi:hypothetical protein